VRSLVPALVTVAVLAAAAPAAAATAPSNTSPPTISGTPQVGQTLTASKGTWTGTGLKYSYQWQRCVTAGAGCGNVSGATSSTYTPVSADAGFTMRVVVTARNNLGSASASSEPTAVVQAASSPPPTTSGVVALWHMDETSGTSMFDSVGSHTGTLHSVQLGVPGLSGTAYGFNGSSSYVSVPTVSDLVPGTANVTVTISLKATQVPATPDWDLIRKGLYTSSGGEYKMEYQPSGQASCGFKGSAGYSELTAGPALNDGRWHTVSCVKTGSGIQVVVDGQSFPQGANIGSITNDTDSVVIGARPGSEYFVGSLDEASISIG
jgi:hypothetical protein